MDSIEVQAHAYRRRQLEKETGQVTAVGPCGTFGFIQPDNEGDEIEFHLNGSRSNGMEKLNSGDFVGFVRFRGRDMIFRAIEIDLIESSSDSFQNEEDDPDQIFEGLLAWFNPKKGFGFVRFVDMDDCFVHYTALNSSGVDSMVSYRDRPVYVKVGPGNKPGKKKVTWILLRK